MSRSTFWGRIENVDRTNELLAAWILDHDLRSYKLIAKAFDGQPGGLTRDDVLDNITLFWLTNTGVSAARLYWEGKLAFKLAFLLPRAFPSRLP